MGKAVKEKKRVSLELEVGAPGKFDEPLRPGPLLVQMKVDDDGKETTQYTVEINEAGTIIYEIHDCEEVLEKGYYYIAAPEFTEIIKLPSFHKYVRRFAAGDVDGEEFLGQIEHHSKDGEVITLDITAKENRITARFVDENVLEIRLPKLMACEECGKIFVPRQKGQKYHSPECGNRARVRDWRRRKAEKQEKIM